MENEIKRIPAILKEVPKSQIADMRRQVLFKKMAEWTEREKKNTKKLVRQDICLSLLITAILYT